MRTLILAAGLVFGLTAVPTLPPATAAQVSQRTVSAFLLEGLDGSAMPLSRYDGKVLLIVNTASRCGFTNQYAGLQDLHERYAAQGLVVIGIPSNDFGGQEPGSAGEIARFCSGTYGVTFPLAAKARVKGTDASPLYRWLYDTLGAENAPRWNFHKYLIGRDGIPRAAFPSHVKPRSGEVVSRIEQLLAETAPQG